MSRVLYQAVIPTNSLRLIYDKAHDELDGKVYRVTGTATWQSTPTVKSQPAACLTIHTVNNVKCYLRFNSQRQMSEWSTEKVVSLMDENSIHDLWLTELKIRLRHDLGLFDFRFKNAPLTQGTEAEDWVARYHQSLFQQGVTTRTQIRHMILANTHAVPGRGSLDPYELSRPGFIRWMAESTGGLVMRKSLELVDEHVLRDVRIEDVMGMDTR